MQFRTDRFIQRIINKPGKDHVDLLIRMLSVVFLLFIFLVGIKVLGGSFKLIGGGFAKGLISVTSNPLSALFSGVLATVLVQSSSVTTSLIVGLVAGDSLPLAGAIPMIMGANLGTSVTNSLVSLGHLKDKNHFKDAFAAATIHDFFNILTVLIMLPIELFTGVLEKTSVALSHVLSGEVMGLKFSSPIKAAIKPVAKGIKYFVIDVLGISGTMSGITLAILSALIIVVSLSLIVKTMKVLIEASKGNIVNNLLSKNSYTAIAFGAILTICVQSSSITTSLLVPMAGAGVLSLAAIFPVTIGANIGTTTTALLAALAGNKAGLAIALVHFLFNISGMLLWYVHPLMRKIPLMLCEKLAALTLKNRLFALAYIFGVFFLVPLLLTVL